MNMSFGSTLRDWRLDADLSQRELARRVGMDYTYLSKIEADLVAAPSEDKIRGLVSALGRDARETEILIDRARQTRVPTDIVKAALIRNPEVGALLRSIKDRRLSDRDISTILSVAGQDAGEPDTGGTEGGEGGNDASTGG